MKVLNFTKFKKAISLLFLCLIFSSALADEFLFIENKGQWPSEILFKSGIPGGEIVIHKEGIYYQFFDTKQLDQLHLSNFSKEGRKTNPTIATKTILLKFQQANPILEIEKKQEAATYFNFFLGNNPTAWKSNVKGFKELTIKNLYKNIDFRIYEINHSLKYEYIIKPQGNPLDIKQEYIGVDAIQFENNNLIFKLPFTVFKELAPFTYQKSGARSKSISAQFQVNQNIVSFSIGEYDKTQSLIIDPELIFSTYSGSTSDNWSHTATNDLLGNLYAGGSVFGSNFPITTGVFQLTAGGTSSTDLITDIVISKYSADGKKLLYSTFLGGSNSEVPHSLIVNSKNELIVYGTTSSINFPITASAYSKHFAGGTALNGEPITTSISFANGTDCFVTVIAENGDKLIGSTLIGGSGNDGIHDSRYTPIRNYGDEFRSEVVVDEADNIYVGTVSNSDDFPMVGSNTKKKSSHDGIIFKLSPTCSNLLWSTYLGGKSYDAINAIRVTAKNEIYVTGVTVSNDFAYGNVYSTDLKGDSDGFIAKFSNGILVAATYIGTSKGDVCLFIDFDQNENIYVMGLTLGTYPISNGVYRIEKSSQFIHSLDKDLKNTIFSTVYGSGRGEGIIDIVPTAFMVNNCGNIYISAWGGKVNVTTGLNPLSSTKNLPITNDAFQKTTTGSNYHFLILEAKAKSLLFASYFGSSAPSNNPDSERGDHLDGGTCRFDKKGIIYHSACVCKSSDGFVSFPMKNSVTTQHNSSNCNMAAFKFDLGSLAADFKILNDENIEVANGCNPSQILLKNASKNALSYQWYIDNQLVSRFENPTYEFKKAGKYLIKLVAYNTKLCISADSLEKEVIIKDFPTKISADTSVCAGKPIQLFASGGTKYIWSPSKGISDVTSNTPTLIPTQSADYVVTISDSVCSVKRTVSIKILNEKTDFSLTNSKEICKGDTIKLEAKGDFYKIEWRYSNNTDSSKTILVNPLKTTSYQATAYYKDGCTPQKSVTLTIDESFQPAITYELNYDCKTPPHLSLKNLNEKNVSYEWNLGNSSVKSASIDNLTYNKSGDYKIKLTATNAIGCILEKDLVVNYTAADGIIPNIITPNNDGLNDTFSIGFPVEKISVYSRWGKLIYTSSAYQNDWGKSVSNGTYFYEITLKNGYVCKGYLDVLN